MKNERIIGALIGLAGAVSNNGKTENTDDIIKKALISEDSDEIIDMIHKEKYLISPGCQSCSSSCGNTADFDMSDFYDSPLEIRDMKERILDRVIKYVKENDELHPETLRAISYMKYDLEKDTYIKLLEKL